MVKDTQEIAAGVSGGGVPVLTPENEIRDVPLLAHMDVMSETIGTIVSLGSVGSFKELLIFEFHILTTLRSPLAHLEPRLRANICCCSL